MFDQFGDVVEIVCVSILGTDELAVQLMHQFGEMI